MDPVDHLEEMMVRPILLLLLLLLTTLLLHPLICQFLSQPWDPHQDRVCLLAPQHTWFITHQVLALTI